MVFSSLLFVFAFLAPQLLIYFIAKKTRTRNIILLVFSLIFYAWGGPQYLLLLTGEAFVSWFTAREIGRSQIQAMKKRWLALECVVLLFLLIFFKYSGFILTNVQLFSGWPEIVPNIILPIGISFYTFQLISYVADVYRGEVEAQQAYWKVLLYCSLFHQCIAGPIVRYSTVADEIEERTITLDDFAAGVRRFSVGLAKKAILANGCGAIADKLAPMTQEGLAAVPTLGIWLGMLCYTLQIYLDFSAYSDMAIGMGRMVGFHYLENFNYPYVAKSVQDFWRRWHISLSTFFRDYVYIPLGGNRKGAGRTYLNLFIVWFLTGMWHGASWNYILWGLYFFVFLALERLFLGKVLEKIPFIGHIYAFFVAVMGWVLFRFTDSSALLAAVRGMFAFGGSRALYNKELISVCMNNLFFFAAALISVFPLGKKIRDGLIAAGRRKGRHGLLALVYFTDALTPFILILLSVLALIGNSYNPFLYFQF